MRKPKTSRSKTFAPDPDAPHNHICDMPGCDKEAGYRAPRSPKNLRDYFWFCLEHVREYNAKWDFYKGMTPTQIESDLRSATSWGRPSWKLGHLGRKHLFDTLHDPMELLKKTENSPFNTKRYPHLSIPKALKEPLNMLGLDWPISMEELKTRYKTLARLHHPDINGGSREAEEKLKNINSAYTTLKTHLTQHPSNHARTG
ncbi:J domain-containing protein [Entomobacter blattae]|nr:J domain-containing protein [Entomobacter blattae]